MSDAVKHPTIPVAEATAHELEEKCQENAWLKRGGYAWQDDPYLEEHPYSFVQVGDIEDLVAFLESGNWSIRSGVVCGDLAFIQQDDGGDEWWTLKRFEDGWLGFESISCERIIRRDPEEFRRMVASMRLASAEQCRRLECMDPDKTVCMLADIIRECGMFEATDSHVEDLEGYLARSLAEAPESILAYLEKLKGEYGIENIEGVISDVRSMSLQTNAGAGCALESKARFALKAAKSLEHSGTGAFEDPCRD